MILDPGFSLTLRPMKYPVFFDMYKTAIKNSWTVEEVDFATDITDLATRMTSGGAPLDPSSGGFLRHRRFDRFQQSRAQPL